MIIKSVYFGNKHPHENTQPTVTYTIENLKKNVLPLFHVYSYTLKKRFDYEKTSKAWPDLLSIFPLQNAFLSCGSNI